MLPISFTQTKFINPLVLFKAFIWYLLRGFQLKNNKKYKNIFLHDFDKNNFSDLLIPDNIRVSKNIENDTLILIGKFKIFLFVKYFFFLRKVRLIDKNFFLTSEASTRMRLWFYDFSSINERNYYKRTSLSNLKRLITQYKKREICILGTGPSFNKAIESFPNNDEVIITCNSSIYEDFLWKNENTVLCFADPVYHFGTSEEALKFKKEVINKFSKKSFFIICPIECVPILKYAWKIDERFIIGLETNSSSTYKDSDGKYIAMKKTSNVLTEFMLPVATMLGKNIYLGGFDGRDKDEKNFWKYSTSTNQDIDSHKVTHTSFFEDRDMRKYYSKHIKIFEKQITSLEKRGFNFINLTKSNIEFLNLRNGI
tara:strand:+ start:23206 stop:24312 length:1107 start_codon:yes stop_codon:yes gene_type:complete